MGVHGKHPTLDYCQCEVSSLDRHAGGCAHQTLTPNTTSRSFVLRVAWFELVLLPRCNVPSVQHTKTLYLCTFP